MKKIAKEIAKATVAALVKEAGEQGVTDYYGKPIPDYAVYIGGIEAVKAFFAKAAAAGNFVILGAA